MLLELQKDYFEKKDIEMMPELYNQRNEEENYISLYQKHHEHLEELMNLDDYDCLVALDKAWTAKNPEL